MTDISTGNNEQLEGYPETALQDLIEQAEEQYAGEVGEHGPGKNWLDDEARWHIWKACDELFQARNNAHDGDYNRALPNFADALNHILMAMEIAAEVGVNEPRFGHVVGSEDMGNDRSLITRTSGDDTDE